MTNILIGLHITTRRWCNLGITNFTMMLRIFFQQRFIGEKTLWQTFGIIQPFDRKEICANAQGDETEAMRCLRLAATGDRTINIHSYYNDQ